MLKFWVARANRLKNKMRGDEYAIENSPVGYSAAVAKDENRAVTEEDVIKACQIYLPAYSKRRFKRKFKSNPNRKEI